MTGINYVFNAQNYVPDQGMPTHPEGKFPAIISNTLIRPTKDGTGGMFVVEFTTQVGRIEMRYNLWNSSAQAVDIAHKQLSALCYVTGVFNVDMNNEGASLRNAQCMIEVAKQRTNPEFNEVRRVLDRNGNEPGKTGAQQSQPGPAQQQPQAQPMQPIGQPQPQPQPQPAGWAGPGGAPQGNAPAWATSR